MTSSAQAVVVVEDTFNDADRDNDGFTDDGNNTPVTTPDGIRWLRVNPWLDVGSFNRENPTFRIVDDAIDPVNNPDGFGTGNAIRVDQAESSADWAGFFDDPNTPERERITLGPNIGDKLVVSFGQRNLVLGAPDSGAGFDHTTLRFGIWQDTDGQLANGTLTALDNDNSPTGTPKIWGKEDGFFAACSNGVGTCGDYGIWARIQSGADPAEAPLVPLEVDHWSIHEEINTLVTGDGFGGQSLGGTGDNETVALPSAVPNDPLPGDYNGDSEVGAADYVLWRNDPASFGGDPDGHNTWRANFGSANDQDNAFFSDIPVILKSPRTVSLTLERVTPDQTGQDVRMEVAVDGVGFGAQPSNPAGPPDNDPTNGITTRDTFDYFMLTHTTPLKDTSVPVTEWNRYLFDNFKVELIPASSGGSAAVPEPASLQLAILLLWSALVARHRYHSKATEERG
jgi:hypothetical protein